MLSPLIACLVGTIVFFILLAFGLPIFVTMGLGAIFGIFLTGDVRLLGMISGITFASGFNWSFVAIPLFVFMGFIAVYNKLGEDLFDTVYRWMGHLPGGLAIASSVFSALFGFCCGSGTAGVVTVGGVCLPEMLKRNYNRRFALGTLATTGGLAALIPPSVPMILYCVLTEASLGKVFIAGIIPGLLLTALICLYIILRATINPALAPRGPKFTWRERIVSLKGLISLVLIFSCVIGGLYFGIWTPIEAGATGAISALLASLIYRRITWKNLVAACIDTTKVFGMLFMLMVCSGLFSFLFYITGTSSLIEKATIGLDVPGWAIIIFMWIVMFILGAPLEPPAIMMICTPIFLPIVLSLGYDPVWFGIIMVLSCEVATLSPPIGMSIFAIMRVAPPGTKMSDVYIGATPYMGIITLLILILLFWPEIVTFLPSTMVGK